MLTSVSNEIIDPSSEMLESPIVEASPGAVNRASRYWLPDPPTTPPVPAQFPVVVQRIPSPSGTWSVRVIPEVMRLASRINAFVGSVSSINTVVLSLNDLFVSVCVWLANTNVSSPVSAGIVAVRGAVPA